MLHGQTALPLGGPLAPASSQRSVTGQTRTRQTLTAGRSHGIGAGVGLGEEAGALGEWRIIQVEHTADLGAGRHHPAHDDVRLGDLGGAVLAEPVGLEPADTRHELRAGVAAVHPELLPVVAVAAELDVRGDRQGTRRVERRGEVDHPAGRVAIEHGARAANHFDPADRPEVDIARLRRAVRRRDRDAVLDDRQPAQAEPWLRRADAEPDAPREPVVASVLDEQPGNAAERLVERGPALGVLDLVSLDHGDRLRHRGEILVSTHDGDRLCERGDFEHDIPCPGRALGDGDRHGLAPKPYHHSLHLIVAGIQSSDLVVPSSVAHGASRAAGFEVPCRHGHAEQDRSAFVLDRSSDSGSPGLRFCRLGGSARRRAAQDDEERHASGQPAGTH